MNTIYESRKGVTRELSGSRHTLPILFEYGWSMARVWLEYAYSMPRVCLRYACTHRTGGQTPCANEITSHSQRAYGSCSTALRLVATLLLMMTVGVCEMWGDDYSGIYYIANGKQLESPKKYYDKNDPSVNFYLCPAQYYYNPEGSGTGVVSTTNNTGKPFLTTYRTNQGDNSIWLIEKVENKSTYYIKYIGVGDDHDKYVIKNPSLKSNFSSGVDDTRLRVHLEEKAKSELNTDAEFEIIQYGESDNIYYGIRISTIDNGWLNPSKGNKEAYVPSGADYIGGIIGYYKDKTPDESGGEGSKWYLEKVPPVISYNSSNLMEISYIDASYTIYYSYGEESTPSPSSEGTFSYSETGPFDPPSGTTTIKAIAIKDEKESGVATFTPTFLLGSTHKYLIQAQGNGWATGNFQGNHYYMIPGDDDNNNKTKVNTTSMLRPSMQWYLLNAGDNYYYIVNNVDNTRMRYNTTNFVHMDTWDEDNANEFKFQIKSSTAGTYNIIPYGVTVDSKYLNKASGNAGDGALGLHNNATDANSRWKFVQQDTPLADTPPFTPSGESTSVYYKILNGNGTTFYITPPANANGNATASNATDDATVKSMSWYFMQVEAPTTTDWLTYYKIINAGTGKALYYAYTANNSPCLKVGDYDGSNDDYKFAFVKSTTADYYYIVPKSHKDDQLNKISTFYRSSNSILPSTTRAASGNVWTFTAADDLFCNNPEFVEENGKIRIKCNTNAAKIYINTENNDDPTSESTLYDPSNNENQNWLATNQVIIKAIAIVSDGTTSASSDVVTLLNKPDVTLPSTTDYNYTYNGTAKVPSVEVSITIGNNTVIAPKSPPTYTVKYENNTNVGTASVTITDNNTSDTWCILNASTTFIINPKAVTITANDASKAYDGTALTESSFTTTALETGDTHTFTVAMTEGSTITNVGTESNVIATVDGTAVTTGTETAIGNYLVTTANGTLTINKRTLTITANPKEIIYGYVPANDGVTYSGFASGENESVLSGMLVYAYNYEQYGNVGSYTITPSGLTGANYDISFVKGTLTVSQREVGLIWSETTSFVYDGASHAPTATATNLVNGDVIVVTVSGAQMVVGNHTATASTLTGDKAGNYKLPDANTQEFSITKVGLIVTAKPNAITYGDAPAGNGVSYEGFVEGDDASKLGGSLDYDYNYKQFGDVGDYTITPKGVTSTNYDISFVAGTLTVAQKEVGLTWSETTSFVYNGSPQAPTATASGLVNGDEIGVTVSGATNAGNHTATASELTGDKAGNYKLPEEPEVKTKAFTITPKSLVDGTALAVGYTLDFGENNTILLTDDVIGSALEIDTDYSVGDDSDDSPKYSLRTVTGINNYTGSFVVRNVVVSFTTDIDQEEWSATFAAESTDGFNIGDGLVLPEGVMAFIISGIRGEWAIPEPLNYIPAGVPVLLVAHKKINGFVPTIAEIEDEAKITDAQEKRNMLEEVTAETPSYNPTTQDAYFDTKKIYLLYKNEFVFNKAGNLKKGKVYLNPNHTTSSSSPSPDPAPARLMIAWNYMTGIKDGRWKMEDGSGERWYTLDGRCLSGKPTTKGLYIVDGKKVVIK